MNDTTPKNPYRVEAVQSLTVLPDGSQPVPLGSGKIMSVLGEGGNAIVYEVWNEQLGVRRAVKLLRPDNRSETFERFNTEMRISAQLRHPNIIQIHAVGEWNNLPYIEMERVEGISLDGLIKEQGALPPVVAVAVAIMVCRALEYTHNHEYVLGDQTLQGILHRDLKPANIMIERDGTVKLMDFGIATPANVSMHTMAGTFVGSLQYLAPEQMRGDRATTASDHFSLGAVMYEMLTGRRAFPEQNMTKLVSQRMAHEFRSLKHFNLRIPKKLRKIVELCMAFEPDKRKKDASVLLRELDIVFNYISKYKPEEIINFFVHHEGRARKEVNFRFRLPVGQIALAAGVVGAMLLTAYLVITLPRRQVYRKMVLSLPPAEGGEDQSASNSNAGADSVRSQLALTGPDDTLAPSPESSSEKNGNVNSPKFTKKQSSAKKIERSSQPKARGISSRETPKVNSRPRAAGSTGLLAQLKAEYGTQDITSILAQEVAKGNFASALAVYEELSDQDQTSKRALLFKLRALIGLGNNVKLGAFFRLYNVNDAEFYLAKARFLISQKKYSEALDLLERCNRATADFSDKTIITRDAMYFKAVCLTGLYGQTDTDDARQQALQSWFDVKYAFRNNQGHAFFAQANNEIRRMASKDNQGQ